MTTRDLWTAKEDAELLKLRSEGLFNPEIARRLGRTYRSVRKRIEILRQHGVAIPVRRRNFNGFPGVTHRAGMMPGETLETLAAAMRAEAGL